MNIYDIAPDGGATMISRDAALMDAASEKEVFMYPTDWKFEPGHRVGLLVSRANAEAYILE